MNLHASLCCWILVFHLMICNAFQLRNDPTFAGIIIEYDNNDKPNLPADLNYSSNAKIKLENPMFDVLTTEKQSKLSHMTEIYAVYGIIEEIELLPNFKKVHIEDCRTKNVIINPKETYQTEELTIVYNKLEKLPQNLKLMTNLKTIQLHDNYMEFIEMADLSGLNNLQEINLAGSIIYEVRATLQNPVYLPRLEKVYLDRNRLGYINFEHWNASSVDEIRLYKNQLQIALGITSSFPGLKHVNIHTNPLNCQWLAEFLQDMKNLKVSVQNVDETSCNKTGPALDYHMRKIKQQELLPVLTSSQKEFRNGLLEKLLELESIDNGLTKIVEQLQKESQLLKINSEQLKSLIG